MPIITNVTRNQNRISVSGVFSIQDVRRFEARLQDAIQGLNGAAEVVLDFSECTGAYSAAMLPVCAYAAQLRQQGVELNLILPGTPRMERLFCNTGWANFIEPKEYEQPDRKKYERQFPAVQYVTHEEQNALINEILDRLLAVIPKFNRTAFAAVEWALNEITDNVINHSQSAVGGLVQLSILDNRSSRIEFTVADAGIGVPATLGPQKGNLNSDADILMEAVRSGVTRNAAEFQGNGLYGTLEICRVSRGKFSLNSGGGVLFTQGQVVTARNDSLLRGTTVDALIDFSEPELLEKALAIDGKVHKPTDYIELKYEKSGLDSVTFSLEEHAPSFRSRLAGKPVRTVLGNLISGCPGVAIDVDFGGVTVISSSFADEVFGKLFAEFGPMRFMQAIRLRNVTPTVQALIDRAIVQRMQAPTAADNLKDE